MKHRIYVVGMGPGQENMMTQEAMQCYLSDFFAEDWNAEFGADYRIHAYLCENATLECFMKENECHGL